MKLTQVELAQRARVSQATISKLESGRIQKPNYEDVVSIAAALEVDPSLLMFTSGAVA